MYTYRQTKRKVVGADKWIWENPFPCLLTVDVI